MNVKQATFMPNLLDGLTTPIAEPNTGVAVNDRLMTVRRCRVTLTNFAIAVLAAQDYGGTKILDLPFKNMLIFGIEVNCQVTKQANTNGIVAATDITMGIGTAVASASTLATTMINVIEATAMTADTVTVDFQKHTNDQSTAVFPLKVADGANTALFMNIAAAITADSSVSVNGTIDIFYMDLGKLV